MITIQTTKKRGAVMIEFVMIIGLLATILASVFFFGWAMGNQQNARIAARYQSWRQARRVPNMTATDINTEFLQSRAKTDELETVTQSYWRVPLSIREDYISAVGAYNTRAQNTAADAILNGYFAGISSVEFEFFFPYEGGIYSKLEGPLYSGHVRDGAEWYRGSASNLIPLRNEFYSELDAQMENLPVKLGDLLRDMYLQRW